MLNLVDISNMAEMYELQAQLMTWGANATGNNDEAPRYRKITSDVLNILTATLHYYRAMQTKPSQQTIEEYYDEWCKAIEKFEG